MRWRVCDRRGITSKQEVRAYKGGGVKGRRGGDGDINRRGHGDLGSVIPSRHSRRTRTGFTDGPAVVSIPIRVIVIIAILIAAAAVIVINVAVRAAVQVIRVRLLLVRHDV